MSKFIDVNTAQGNNQIGIVGSKGITNDINFYSKRDSLGNLILSFKASDGYVILSTANAGIATIELEKFIYSGVTQPASNNISDLIQTLNGFLYT